MKELIITIIVVAVGWGVAHTLTAPDNSKNMEAFERGFVSECVNGGASYGDCQCMYDYMDGELTDDEFIDMAERYGENEIIPTIMYDAVSYCTGGRRA